MSPRIAIALLLPFLIAAGSAEPEVRPGIDLERLKANEPGWILVEYQGDARSGSLIAEQVIWPMFYLHWMPLGGAREAIGVEEARRAVEGLWDGLVIDSPLEGREIAMPAHPAAMFETTTSHGERKTRYFVWACPASGRLFIADTNLSLLANAPTELLDWQRDMARTVRCHADARVDTYTHLPERYEIPDVDIAYSHPITWRPLQAYRVQTVFGGSDLAASRYPGSTREKGQDLALAIDAMRRVYFIWEPAPDAPLSYDLLRQMTNDHWREIANDLMIVDTAAVDDVWLANGILRMPIRPEDIPPTHMHKFRTWMWRKDKTLFFAAGDLGGIRFGRRKPPLPTTWWDWSLQEMFEALTY